MPAPIARPPRTTASAAMTPVRCVSLHQDAMQPALAPSATTPREPQKIASQFGAFFWNATSARTGGGGRVQSVACECPSETSFISRSHRMMGSDRPSSQP